MSNSHLNVCIVVSDFYPDLSKELLDNCINTLNDNGVTKIKIINVPGSLEIPFVIKRIIDSKQYCDVVIALGIIIKGETYHFECVANETARAITDLNLYGKIPIIFGVLTTTDIQQVKDRVSMKKLNKGKEFAETAIKMFNLNRTI